MIIGIVGFVSILGMASPVYAKPDALRAVARGRATIGLGKLTAMNGTTLTVERDGKSYTVLTGTFDKCTTKFNRRYWGTSSLSEYTLGDMINVYGIWQDDAKTTIEACVLRDISIQKRYGVFVGEITSLTSTGWVMTTVSDKRTSQMVTVTGSTKFVNRKEQAISQADIQVGHRVRVKGMGNRVNKTVTEVTHVKDFNLPERPTTTQ